MSNVNFAKYIYAKDRIKLQNINLNVISDCMLPVIDIGDEVEIMFSNKFYKGDVVAVYIGDDFFLHRVIRVKGNTIITKGDRAYKTDPEVGCEKVIGVAIRNKSKQTVILRKKLLLSIIAEISYLEAILYNKMKYKKTHKNYLYIYKLRRIVEKLFLCCVEKSD